MRDLPGSPSTTRTATFPTERASEGSGTSSSGSHPPAIDQVRPKVRSSAGTTGPRSSTPVSRHAGTPASGSPTHSSPMHIPDTDAHVPSTETSFRWLRRIRLTGSPSEGGPKARTSTPASRNGFQNRAGVAQHPSQS